MSKRNKQFGPLDQEGFPGTIEYLEDEKRFSLGKDPEGYVKFSLLKSIRSGENAVSHDTDKKSVYTQYYEENEEKIERQREKMIESQIEIYDQEFKKLKKSREKNLG